MSLKDLLGLNEAGISDTEIMGKIRAAQRQNLDSVEFKVGSRTVRVSFPHIAFDPHADEDMW